MSATTVDHLANVPTGLARQAGEPVEKLVTAQGVFSHCGDADARVMLFDRLSCAMQSPAFSGVALVDAVSLEEDYAFGPQKLKAFVNGIVSHRCAVHGQMEGEITKRLARIEAPVTRVPRETVMAGTTHTMSQLDAITAQVPPKAEVRKIVTVMGSNRLLRAAAQDVADWAAAAGKQFHPDHWANEFIEYSRDQFMHYYVAHTGMPERELRAIFDRIDQGGWKKRKDAERATAPPRLAPDLNGVVFLIKNSAPSSVSVLSKIVQRGGQWIAATPRVLDVMPATPALNKHRHCVGDGECSQGQRYGRYQPNLCCFTWEELEMELGTAPPAASAPPQAAQPQVAPPPIRCEKNFYFTWPLVSSKMYELAMKAGAGFTSADMGTRVNVQGGSRFAMNKTADISQFDVSDITVHYIVKHKLGYKLDDVDDRVLQALRTLATPVPEITEDEFVALVTSSVSAVEEAANSALRHEMGLRALHAHTPERLVELEHLHKTMSYVKNVEDARRAAILAMETRISEKYPETITLDPSDTNSWTIEQCANGVQRELRLLQELWHRADKDMKALERYRTSLLGKPPG
jgi:hypothetical protein